MQCGAALDTSYLSVLEFCYDFLIISVSFAFSFLFTMVIFLVSPTLKFTEFA